MTARDFFPVLFALAMLTGCEVSVQGQDPVQQGQSTGSRQPRLIDKKGAKDLIGINVSNGNEHFQAYVGPNTKRKIPIPQNGWLKCTVLTFDRRATVVCSERLKSLKTKQKTTAELFERSEGSAYQVSFACTSKRSTAPVPLTQWSASLAVVPSERNPEDAVMIDAWCAKVWE